MEIYLEVNGNDYRWASVKDDVVQCYTEGQTNGPSVPRVFINALTRAHDDVGKDITLAISPSLVLQFLTMCVDPRTQNQRELAQFIDELKPRLYLEMMTRSHLYNKLEALRPE